MENTENVEKTIQYPEIAKEIEEMVNKDQDMREKSLNDADLWDKNIDIENTKRMQEIISEIGWPSASGVGKESAHSASLLVRHSDHDIDFQGYCLDLMKQTSEGEVEKRDIAYLEDRIRAHKNLPQIYGTQFEEHDGEFIPREIEDLEHVDERRLSMGLGTLKEGIEDMYGKYNMPKPKE